MEHINFKNALFALYALSFGFFSGILLMGVIPLQWPYNVIGGYATGLLVGIFVSFELFRKWQRPAFTKIIAAMILLLMIAAVSGQLSLMSLQITKMNFSLMYP